MKIAYISTAYLSDCDLPLIREMTNLGHEVTYILQMSPNTRQATVVNVPKIKEIGGIFKASEYEGLEFMADYLPLDNVYVQNIANCREWHPSSLKSVWSLLLFLIRKKFDVIHLTWPLRYSAFPLYVLRNKMILTMHDPIPHSSDRNLLNSIYRWMAFKNVRNFIILSESLKEEFVKMYGLEQKIVFVSRLGIYEILKKSVPAEMKLPQNYILFVGSINPHKGIKYLCEAMHTVHKQYPELYLVIAGRGKFDFDIDKYCAKLPIHVINRFILNEELLTLMRQSRMVVCPYIDATQSGVIMSAFALNKPVVCTNVGALPEMVKDNRYGKIVAPENSQALADAIVSMNTDDVLNQMSEFIDKDHSQGMRSWRSIAEETISFYNNTK